MLDFIINIDTTVIQFVDKYFHNPVTDVIMIIFSFIGVWGGVWIAIALFLLFQKQHRRKAILIGISLILSLIFIDGILKNIFQRERPYEVLTYIKLIVPPESSHSFPSGHTSSSFAAAVMLFLCFRKHFFSLLGFSLAVLISFSRLYLKVHYPSDILVGALVGTCCALIAYWGDKWIRQLRSKAKTELSAN